jgi:hypothetical protein
MHLFTSYFNMCRNWGTWAIHERRGVDLSQCISERGRRGRGDFCKILLTLWMTWFIFLYVIIFAQYCSRSTCLISVWHLLFSVLHIRSSHSCHHFKVKGQGHGIMKVGCQRNPYFLRSCHQINSKLGVKVAYGLPLSWLIFAADQPWHSLISLWVKNCLSQDRILKIIVSYSTI